MPTPSNCVETSCPYVYTRASPASHQMANERKQKNTSSSSPHAVRICLRPFLLLSSFFAVALEMATVRSLAFLFSSFLCRDASRCALASCDGEWVCVFGLEGCECDSNRGTDAGALIGGHPEIRSQPRTVWTPCTPSMHIRQRPNQKPYRLLGLEGGQGFALLREEGGLLRLVLHSLFPAERRLRVAQAARPLPRLLPAPPRLLLSVFKGGRGKDIGVTFSALILQVTHMQVTHTETTHYQQSVPHALYSTFFDIETPAGRAAVLRIAVPQS